MKRVASILIFSLLLTHQFVYASNVSVKATNNEAVMTFPEKVVFSADLESAATITKVKLHYGSSQESCGNVSGIAFPDMTPGKAVSVKWEWNMRQDGGEPPGATIWWQWEIVDSQGKSELTERKEITWLDDIHDWRELDEGLVRLHYYDTHPTYGPELKDAAVKALARLTTDIGIQPAKPIDLYIYNSNDDMRDAVFYEPGWTGGLAFTEYNILIIGIDPTDLTWGKSTEAHEMTHVLVGNYTYSCMGETPTWLDEGLAVYGEGGPNSTEVAIFNKNKKSDTLLSFPVLSGGFSEDPNAADLSYSQSFYMVDYLIKTYGKEKMLSLLSEIKAGSELNDALEKSYGFDLTGFENEWRKSYGLAAVSTGVETSTPVPTLIPTIIPIQGAKSQPVGTPKPTSSALEPTPLSTENISQPSNPEANSGNLNQLMAKLLHALPIILIALVVVLAIIITVILLALRKKGDRQ
jgi:hypothetical protein